jgi:iron complex outermembrane receptor protein
MSIKNPFDSVRWRTLCGTILASGLATFAIASPALAQTTADGSTAIAGEVSDGADGSGILVTGLRATTATKTDTPLKEIPQAISVVTIGQIIDQGALTMQDSLRYTAGVTNGGTDTRGDFNFIRGFSAVTFLDGLKRNFGYVYLPQVEVYTLDRVEALLGPSAVLYGAGSAGGLINMASKRPSFTFGGEATASYGTYDRKQAQIDLTGPLSESVAVRLTAVYRDSDTLTDYLPDNRLVIQPSITWQPDTDTTVTLLGLYQRDRNGPSNFLPIAASLYADADAPRIPSSRNIGEPDFDTGTKKDKSATLLVDHTFSDVVSFHSGTRIEGAKSSYGQFFQSAYSFQPFILDSAGNTTGFVPRSVFGFRAKYRTFNTDNRIELNFATGDFTHKVLFGVDYSDFKQLARQAFDVTTPIDIYDPVYGNYSEPVFGDRTRQTLKQLGFYAQDQIKFREVASLVLGLRHDNLKTSNTGLADTDDNAMTYRAGLTVNVTKTISPYASYSESFQPISGLNQFGQSFKPLYGKAYEFGVKWQPLRDTLVRGDYFHIVENNHVVPDPANPLVSIQAGKQRSRGFEFQVDHRLRDDLTLTASYAHLSSRNSNEDYDVDLQPKTTASVFAVKSIKLTEDLTARLGGGVRYVGRQTAGSPDFVRVVTPDYTLADGFAELNYRQWTLQVNATNLFDHFYYAACSQYAYCVPGDERQVYGTIRYRF